MPVLNPWIATDADAFETDNLATLVTPPAKVDTLVPLPDMARTTIDLSQVFYSRRTMKLVTEGVLNGAPDMPLAARAAIANSHFEGLIPLDVEGGSLAKRIRNWLYKEHNYKASDALAQQIGEIAAHAKNLTFEVDLTKDFSWRSGDFGDTGSCMWGSGDYAYARCVTLPRLHASALRFYRNNAGRGRLWIIPLPLDVSNGYQAYAMTNYYGDNVTPSRTAALMTHLMHRLFPETGAWESVNGTLLARNLPLYINPAQPMILRPIGADVPTTVTFTPEHLDERMALPAWAQAAYDEFHSHRDDRGDDDDYNEYDDDPPY